MVRGLSGINTCAQPVASEMSPVRSGMSSVVSGCSSVVCDDCLRGAAALRLTYSLFFAPLLKEALIGLNWIATGPITDVGVCQVTWWFLKLLAPGQAAEQWGRKKRGGVASLAEIAFSSVGYRSTRPHAD